MYRTWAFQFHLEEERVEQSGEQSVVMMMMMTTMPESAETSETTETTETSETSMVTVVMVELTGHLQVVNRLSSDRHRHQRLHLDGQWFNLGHWHGHHAAHVRQSHQQHQLF